MKLTVAANFDIELIPQLAHYPVVEVFGKFPIDFAGGGRPSYMAAPLSHRKLAKYVYTLNEHKIEFNYLLNPACTANQEWTRSWQKKFVTMLRKLDDIGVSRLTVTTPYLLETIKSRFPQFKVKVGLYALVDSVKRAQFWESLGADSINLECRSINRDFTRLAAIRKSVKCELQLIANHICIPNCPMLAYHQNSIAHASVGSNTVFIDYCFFRCSRMRLEDPSLLIKAGWIRPEDISAYEDIGYDTFKILERGIPSSELLKRVQAYANRKYEGNLADILLPYGFKQAPQKRRFWALRNFFKPLQFRTRYIKSFFEIAKAHGMMFNTKKPPFYIDSKAIGEDFITGFKNRDCAMLDCAQCRYCEHIAEKAVRVDPEFQKQNIARFAHIENALRSGGLWNV